MEEAAADTSAWFEPVPSVALPSEATSTFARANGQSAPRTPPPPPVAPPVLSRLSEETYAFGNEQMGYFYIPSASLPVSNAPRAHTRDAETKASEASNREKEEKAEDGKTETRGDGVLSGSTEGLTLKGAAGVFNFIGPDFRARIVASDTAIRAGWAFSVRVS